MAEGNNIWASDEGEAFLAMVDCEFIASDRTCEFNGSEGGAFLT